MQLYEGDRVQIIKVISDLGMIECRFNNQVGVFPIQTIKLIKRGGNHANGSPPISNHQTTKNQEYEVSPINRRSVLSRGDTSNEIINTVNDAGKNPHRKNFFNHKTNEMQSYHS
jgi:hypothetical protein